MRIGFAALVAAYVLSQFYRAFLAVLAPLLSSDLAMSKSELASASGLWFLGFALAQLPIGVALDRFGPRRTAAALLGLCGGGGAVMFATATGSDAIKLAMVLIGIGCAPVLMASFYIFARLYRPAVFATLAALVVGLGNSGNLAAALPLSLLVELLGWRVTLGGLAAVTVAVALLILCCVKDPVHVPRPEGAGRFWTVIGTGGFWAILVMLATSYVGAAAIRGLWAAPYLADLYGADAAQIGTATLVMGLAMVLGSLAYGPLDRLVGSRKRPILIGNLVGGLALAVLWLQPMPGFWAAVLLFAVLGLFGSSYSLMMAHGRAFFPPHQLGLGVTLLNLFSIGGVGVFQTLSGTVFEAGGPLPEAAYGLLFGYFAAVVLGGCLIYALFARDRLD